LANAADDVFHAIHDAVDVGPDLLTAAPMATLTTPDGYKPPIRSLDLVKGVPFQLAERVGQRYTERFARWDRTSKGKKDPSLCRGLYRLPANVLFWESKMAVDADEATTPSVLASSSGSSQNTSCKFRDGSSVNAEIVPYFVVPTHDARRRPGAPWEGSGDKF